MMPGKDGVSQIVEALATGLAQVSLTLGLSVVATVLGHFSGLTSWTTDAVWPTQGPDGLKAFSVVDGSNRNGIQLSSDTPPINKLRTSHGDRVAVSRIGSVLHGAG
jgi:hypothetical protein